MVIQVYQASQTFIQLYQACRRLINALPPRALVAQAVVSMLIGWSGCGSGFCLSLRLGLVFLGLAWSTRGP